MAKGQRKTILKANPLLITRLLVQFSLIKIGQIPLYIVYGIWYIGRKILNFRLNFQIPKYKIQNTKYQLPRFHRGRGRPRNAWFVPYYFKKFKIYFRRRVSRRTKIGLAALTVLIILFLYTQFILNAAYQLPTPERLTSPAPATTEIYDRNNKLLYRIYEGRNRSIVKLSELPKYLISATLAAEDKNFYNHPGIDPIAMARAAYHNIRYGRQEGASTITQQLIKNSLLTAEKTYSRKFKEIILSLWAETKYSKDEILQMYFNEAPYGGPNWGIKSAAKSYFNKAPGDLTLSESAFLAGLPASPTLFSPYGTRPDLGLARQKQVLKRMLEEKFITEGQFTQALAEQLVFKSREEDIKAPHFVFYIKEILTRKYGERVVSQGGLKVITTLDLGLQQEIEKIVSEEVAKLAILNVKNGAAMVLDAKGGQVLAMVGSRGYFYPDFGNFNATLALRQPGSSIKPITYATAFKKGYLPGNTILDSPVTFKDGLNSYSPVNYDGTFHGPVSIRQALGSSYNVPAVKMLASVGMEEMIQTARDLGITTFEDKDRFGLSLTLGGGEVTMIEMMGVYQAFSQMGRLNQPTGILKVTDSEGNVLEEYENNSTQVLQPEVAYLITNILSDNRARTPAFGPNSLLYFTGQEVAVKTGTSDNKRDNWTFGYTPDFVVGVWVGNNDNSPMNHQLASGITGAAPIWNRITKGILSQHPSIGFVKPEGIIEARIDGRRDLAISGSISKSLVRTRTEEDEQSSTGYKTIYFDSFSSYATASAQAATLDRVAN